MASLHQFAVDPSAQGRGWGRALLGIAMRWARERGFGELALDTPAAARHLVDYYRGQGFRVVGELRKAHKNYCSVVLSKTLADVPHQRSIWYSPHRMACCGSLVRC